MVDIMLADERERFLIYFPPNYSAKLVDLALASGKIFDGEGFNYIKESFASNTLHLIGLLSDGGVHSRIDQVQVKIIGFLSLLHTR